MLRSSSMLITRARSVRNATKLPFRFTFDLLIDTVDKIAITGPVVLVWERSVSKVISTKAVTVDRSSRKANFGNEQLTSEITLFKNSPQDKRFQDKVVKLAIKGGNSEGKTLGKIHLNLADHAELPSGSKKISAELNNGSVLIACVQCQFISMGNSPSAGASSNAFSSAGTNATAGNKSSPRSKQTGKSLHAMNSGVGTSDMLDESDIEADIESLTSESENGTPASSGIKGRLSKLGRIGSKRGIGAGRKGRNSELGFTNVSLDGGGGNAAGGGGGADGGAYEKLKRENKALKKQLEELEKGGGSGGSNTKLVEENKSLKREIDSLKDALKRDPEFHELVSQLKETKMALALLQMERDQLAQQSQKKGR